jgi:hypothetical protein
MIGQHAAADANSDTTMGTECAVGAPCERIRSFRCRSEFKISSFAIRVTVFPQLPDSLSLSCGQLAAKGFRILQEITQTFSN